MANNVNQERENFIAEKSTEARNKFKKNINAAANHDHGTNEKILGELQEYETMLEQGLITQQEFDEASAIKYAVMHAKEDSKKSGISRNKAIRQITNALNVSDQEEYQKKYPEAKGVLMSENDADHRQTVLKEAALDDLEVLERRKLALANTNNAARAAAGRLYNIQKLKADLEQLRQESKLPSEVQNKRYSDLIEGLNFNALPASYYKSLKANNAVITKDLIEKEEARIAAAMAEAKQKEEQEAANRKARLNAERKAALEARFGKKKPSGNQNKSTQGGRRRKTSRNRKTRRNRKN